MSTITKLLFTLTVLALPLFIIAFTYQDNWLFCTVEALLLIFLSFSLLNFAEKELQLFEIKITNFESTDRNCFWIFLSLLIPIAGKQFNIDWIPLTATGVLLLACLYSSIGFSYNPVFLLLGWHFYTIELPEGGKYILLSKKKLINNHDKLVVSKITDYVLIARDREVGS